MLFPKNREEQKYLSVSYSVFMVYTMINAVVLGLCSFSKNAAVLSIADRIIGMFKVTEHAGLIKIFGQIPIMCALADK